MKQIEFKVPLENLKIPQISDVGKVMKKCPLSGHRKLVIINSVILAFVISLILPVLYLV